MMLRLEWLILVVAFAFSVALKEPLKSRTIGFCWELFVDDWLIAEMKGVTLQLHHPTPQEVVITFDQIWEGSTSGYVTVFQDGDRF